MPLSPNPTIRKRDLTKLNQFFHETAERLMGNPETKISNTDLLIRTVKNQKLTFSS